MFKQLTRVLTLFCMLVLVVLGVLEWIPLQGQDASYINDASLQRTRVEVIANSMMILEYRPQERAQAVALLQTTLPLFIQEQATIGQNTAPDVQLLFQQSRSDFLAIVSAVQTVTSQPSKPVDPVQVSIVLMKRDTYRATLNQLTTILIAHAEETTTNLFIIKMILLAVLFSSSNAYWLLFERNQKEKKTLMQTQTSKALITFAESVSISAFITGSVAIEPMVAGSGPINWGMTGSAFGLLFLFSLAHAIIAYVKPATPQEQQLEASLEVILDAIERRYAVATQPKLTPVPQIYNPANTVATVRTNTAPVAPTPESPFIGGEETK